MQLTISQIILSNIPARGLELLAVARSELTQALLDISEDYDALSPEPSAVFRVFRECPKPKVVLLGQDPYPSGADGLSFSCQKIRSSLKNIFKCLRSSQLMAGEPKTGDLSAWSAEGVMLLNTALTTRQGCRGSHVKAWAPFTRKIIEALASRENPPVFLLLGDHAKSFEKVITDRGALALSWGHPSSINTVNSRTSDPLAFINCTVFTRANALLESRKEVPVRWGILAAPTAVEDIDPTGGAGICAATAPEQVRVLEPPENITKDDLSQEFNPKELDMILSSKKLWFFTDGGAVGTRGPNCRAAWGVCVKSVEHGIIAERSGSINPPATNNRGELTAMVVAILMVELITACGFTGAIVLGYDSEYAAKSLTLPSWSSAVTSSGAPRKNMDMIIPAREWLQALIPKVVFVHIHSHKKPPTQAEEYFKWHGNDCADKLCTAILTKK